MNIRVLKLFLTSLFLFTFLSIKGQEVYVGDSLAMTSFKEKASEIYEAFDSTFFLLTKNTFGIVESHGSSLIINTIGGRIARIVSINHSENGVMGSEWYFDRGDLFYIYFSFEQFEEIESGLTWRNFKGAKGWESRFYFSEKKVIVHRHKGVISILAYDFESLQRQGNDLFTFVKQFLE